MSATVQTRKPGIFGCCIKKEKKSTSQTRIASEYGFGDIQPPYRQLLLICDLLHHTTVPLEVCTVSVSVAWSYSGWDERTSHQLVCGGLMTCASICRTQQVQHKTWQFLKHATMPKPFPSISQKGQLSIPAASHWLWQDNTCCVHSLKDASAVDSSCDFPDQNWCHTLWSQLLVHAEKIDLNHLLNSVHYKTGNGLCTKASYQRQSSEEQTT